MSKKSAQAATLRSLYEAAVSDAVVSTVVKEGGEILADYFIGAYEGNPAKDFDAKLKVIRDNFQAALAHANDEPGTAVFHAYSDVVLYGTPAATAAEDAEAEESDVAWLLGVRPASEQTDKTLFSVSKEVKKLREPKEEKKAPSKKKKNDE